MISYTPKTLQEIPACLSRMTEKDKIIGGGTDLIIRLNMGLSKPEALCYLGYVDELKRIMEEEDRLVIGAYATMTGIENHPAVKEYFPALMDAASDVGSLQIRNNGTIGGNIGNASPAGDLLPVLYLYNAQVEIMGAEGNRVEPIEQIIAGPGRTTLAYNEAVTRIFLPRPAFVSSFVKLGFRRKVTISRIGIALGVQMDGDYVKDVRLVIGAISLKPVRLTAAEEFLRGKPLNESNIMEAARILSDLIMEITPREFDRDYKVFASRGIVMDAFKRLRRD
ncbi:FAD binding domain-containing protein [Hungatella hathewayi]|uniref:FAD binding domain-containing protein n=1 Tax=Hungatella hathewayi TaxID=154046 RepID=UPI003561E707